MFWLLADDALRELASAARTVQRTPVVAAGSARVYAASTSVATINIEGVLTRRPDVFASMFGGGNTSYSAVIDALDLARTDPAIASVVLAIDSPGGSADGLFECLAAVEALRATKPVAVRARNALSAAYAIAAAAGSIEATSVASAFGSLGVAASIAVDISIVTLANTDSPNKRPDVRTDEGKAVMRRQLDALHELFVAAIASGRDISTEKVTESFGRGATVLAGEATKLGMIDSIAGGAVPGSGAAVSASAVDAGDIVAEHMRAQAEGRDVAAWALRPAPTPQASKPKPTVVLGPQMAAAHALIKTINEHRAQYAQKRDRP